MGDRSGDAGVYIDGAYVLPACARTREVWKAYRYRLYPKPAQEAYFHKLFGCCRYVYNYFLEVRIKAWEAKQSDPDVHIPTWVDMSRELTQLKRDTVGKDGAHFLREVDATALVNELRHLDMAFAGFFRRAKKGAGKPGFPKFKGRYSKKSATVAFENADYLGDNRIRFAKLGWVYANIHRPIEGRPVSLTVSQDASGAWWASVKCKDVPAVPLPESRHAIALSVGDAPWVVTSDGEVIDYDEPAESKRIARAKRRLAKCQGPARKSEPSARYEKQRMRTAALYAKEAARRADAINKLTSDIVGRYGTVIVRGAGSSELGRQLRYKCAWRGRALVALPGAGDDPGVGESLTLDERIQQAKRDLELGKALLGQAACRDDKGNK